MNYIESRIGKSPRPRVRGECPQCEGEGSAPVYLGEDRQPGVGPCQWCREYCRACDRWVRKPAFGGHVCKGA